MNVNWTHIDISHFRLGGTKRHLFFSYSAMLQLLTFFSTSQPQKTFFLQNSTSHRSIIGICIYLDHFFMNQVKPSKMAGNGIFQQEVKLIHPLRLMLQQHVFYKTHLISFKDFKTCFRKQEMELSNRKWNYFTHLSLCQRKTSFTKYICLFPKSSKAVFKNRKWTCSIGNGII